MATTVEEGKSGCPQPRIKIWGEIIGSALGQHLRRWPNAEPRIWPASHHHRTLARSRCRTASITRGTCFRIPGSLGGDEWQGLTDGRYPVTGEPDPEIAATHLRHRSSAASPAAARIKKYYESATGPLARLPLRQGAPPEAEQRLEHGLEHGHLRQLSRQLPGWIRAPQAGSVGCHAHQPLRVPPPDYTPRTTRVSETFIHLRSRAGSMMG